MSLPRLVCLDLAGTTVEDRGQVPAAFEAALAAHGIAITPARIDDLRGASKRAAIDALVPPGDDQGRRSADAFAAFRRELHARYAATGVRALPGAGDVIRSLRSQGIRVALNTGFDRDTTGMLLAHLGWTDVADAVVCGDDVVHGRPAPDLIRRAMERAGVADPAEVANVGDTALDLEAAHRAGVRWNVGVLSGAHDRARLEAAPHTHLIAGVADLPGVFGGPR